MEQIGIKSSVRSWCGGELALEEKKERKEKMLFSPPMVRYVNYRLLTLPRRHAIHLSLNQPNGSFSYTVAYNFMMQYYYYVNFTSLYIYTSFTIYSPIMTSYKWQHCTFCTSFDFFSLLWGERLPRKGCAWLTMCWIKFTQEEWMAEPSCSTSGSVAMIPAVLSRLPTPGTVAMSCFSRLIIFKIPSKCSNTSWGINRISTLIEDCSSCDSSEKPDWPLPPGTRVNAMATSNKLRPSVYGRSIMLISTSSRNLPSSNRI